MQVPVTNSGILAVRTALDRRVTLFPVVKQPDWI